MQILVLEWGKGVFMKIFEDRRIYCKRRAEMRGGSLFEANMFKVFCEGFVHLGHQNQSKFMMLKGFSLKTSPL